MRSADFQDDPPAPGELPAETAAPANAPIEPAILKALLYSDLFDYPLTIAEIAHFLIGRSGSEAEVETALRSSAWLSARIAAREGFFTLPGRESLVDRRRRCRRASKILWRKARFYAEILSRFPFIRMVAVTGALAMDNCKVGDDVDLLLATAPSRVWLARGLAVLVVHAGRFSPNTLCPNYVISEQALSLGPRTIYVAHEFAQMVPLYGREIHAKMLAANPWILELLPNALRPLRVRPEVTAGWMARRFKAALERPFSGRMGDRVEAWEMRRKIRKFTKELGPPGSGVILDRHQVKGHFDDHGALVSARFHERLEEWRLSAPCRD